MIARSLKLGVNISLSYGAKELKALKRTLDGDSLFNTQDKANYSVPQALSFGVPATKCNAECE